MAERRPLIIDPTTGLPTEMPAGDHVPSDNLPSPGAADLDSIVVDTSTGTVVVDTSNGTVVHG